MKKYLFLSLFFLFPALTHAQDLGTFLGQIEGYMDTLIPLAASLAFLVFLVGIVRFIWNADNEEKRKDGKQQLLWGIIALFVVFAIWGIIAVIAGTFNIGVGGKVTPPVVDCNYFESLGEECPQ